MAKLLEIKQVIILRKDLRMSKGKAAAQASHAAVASALKSKLEKTKEFTLDGRVTRTLHELY